MAMVALRVVRSTMPLASGEGQTYPRRAPAGAVARPGNQVPLVLR